MRMRWAPGTPSALPKLLLRDYLTLLVEFLHRTVTSFSEEAKLLTSASVQARQQQVLPSNGTQS